jgi:hypothetical protein
MKSMAWRARWSCRYNVALYERLHRLVHAPRVYPVFSIGLLTRLINSRSHSLVYSKTPTTVGK